MRYYLKFLAGGESRAPFSSHRLSSYVKINSNSSNIVTSFPRQLPAQAEQYLLLGLEHSKICILRQLRSSIAP